MNCPCPCPYPFPCPKSPQMLLRRKMRFKIPLITACPARVVPHSTLGYPLPCRLFPHTRIATGHQCQRQTEEMRPKQLPWRCPFCRPLLLVTGCRKTSARIWMQIWIFRPAEGWLANGTVKMECSWSRSKGNYEKKQQSSLVGYRGT